MRVKTAATGFLVWLAVVAVASAVTWAVIDRAGQNLVAGDAGGGHVQASSQPTETEVAAEPEPSSEPTKSRKPRRERGPNRRPSKTASEQPARTPSAQPSTEQPEPQAQPQPQPQPQPQRTRTSRPRDPQPPRQQPSKSPSPRPPTSSTRTWQGPAGLVTVRCTDGRAFLESAVPGNGYQYEVRERDAEEVEVRFESEASETRVRADCEDGGPRFEVETEAE